jgi:acetamidase/formamidase
MTRHTITAAPGRVTDVFSRDTPPAATVRPGDTVVVGSLDASGYLARQRHPGDDQPTMFTDRRGHCLTGPIAVDGAEPGMVLAVRFASLRPGDWGWTVAAARDNRLTRRLGVAQGPPSWLLWDIDAEAGLAVSDGGHTVAIAPFLGVVGMPPAEPGEHSTIPPRAEGGGNIDCRELVAGSVLYLPVTVPSALLCLGDGHAAQGDGEVSGTAIECAMTTEVVLDLLGGPPGPARPAGPPVPGIHADTPAGRVTFGFSPDLDEAMGDALDTMLTWMQSLYGLDRAAALALAGPTVDLRVTQVANDVWGVHAVLPSRAARLIEGQRPAGSRRQGRAASSAAWSGT